jgi:hypothetical protein
MTQSREWFEGQPDDELGDAIERVLCSCRLWDNYLRPLGCHFYKVIKNHQLTLKTRVRSKF